MQMQPVAPPEKVETSQVQAQETPKILYSIESFRASVKELIPLFIKEWDETAFDKNESELEPDYHTYFTLEDNGKLLTFIARENGKIVGFIIFIISRSLHRHLSIASADTYFVEREKRSIGIWNHLLKFSEEFIKNIGINSMTFRENLFFSKKSGNIVGSMFERKGYQPVETVYYKRLDYGN